MSVNVRQFLEAAPFEPFTIVSTGGRRYYVPTPDHAGVSPKGTDIVVWFDDGGIVTIARLHVATIEKGRPVVGP